MFGYVGGKKQLAGDIVGAIFAHSERHRKKPRMLAAPDYYCCNKFYDLFGGGGSISEKVWEMNNAEYLFFAPNYCKSVHYNDLRKGACELNSQLWSGTADFARFEMAIETMTKKRWLVERKEESAWGMFLHCAFSYNFSGDCYLLQSRRASGQLRNNCIDIIRGFICNMKATPKTDIIVSNADYTNIDIIPNSIVYCDIPYYKNHNRYQMNFNYCDFYDWAVSQSAPVYFSDYEVPDFCRHEFEVIWEKDVKITACADHLPERVERIFWNGKIIWD